MSSAGINGQYDRTNQKEKIVWFRSSMTFSSYVIDRTKYNRSHVVLPRQLLVGLHHE